jgi:hypothetical protein
MNLRILIIGFVLLPQLLFGQGTVIFSNRGGISTTAAPGATIAPVYSYPVDGRARISGNTSTGVPAGNTSYGSTPFLHNGNSGGNTWVASLWGLNSTNVTGDGANNNLLFLATTTFRTTTSGTFAGIWIPPQDPVPVPGITDPNQRGTFQVRVWDTKGGTVTTWEQATAIGASCLLLGYSDLFTVPYPLGDDSNPAPYLQGLQSFSLIFTPSICIPEPSVVVLGLIGGGALLLWRRRANTRSRQSSRQS